jgi:DNA repair exonuclease SbcCD ATPase subunit
MITIKTLAWSNAFSYGLDNKIDFVAAPLTQLVGKNGHGKSSIALVLEEVLFNKNSKGIKKADILNRYVKDKHYAIELVFDRDGTEYKIETRRGTAQTVKLYKDGVDISAHTATATYKIVEEVIGIDHKTFSQIVYQSNASSLEFLTAADTARKKFLIEILNLGKYTQAQDVFKEVAQDLSKDITATQSQVNTVVAWLDKYSKTDLTPKQLVDVQELDSEVLQEAAKLEVSIQGVESTNRKISQNNTYKQLQSKITLVPLPPKPEDDISQAQLEAKNLNTETIELQKTVKDSEAFVQKMNKLHGNCPTCLQTIDTNKISELVKEQVDIQLNADIKSTQLRSRLEQINSEYRAYTAKKSTWEAAQKSQEEWEKYHQLIDTELPDTVLDKAALQNSLADLESSIKATRDKITAAEKTNQTVSAHNSKVETISKQLAEMSEELEVYSEKLHELSERMSIVNVLTKTFSTTGLVAYKIECLVKDLEEITNNYLVDLSDGRFQISFKISASDKLNVVITDNGRDIEMLALSGGERARVNVATLLAIRKLMQTLSSSRINLLILDETVEALDVDGKEKLVEVLLKEEHLNTFLVSHGFSHPLLEKVNVVKRNNISHIEA